MITREGGSGILAPHHRSISRITHDSWKTFQKILKEYPFFSEDKTARANVVHAQARALAHEEFDSLKDVEVIPHPPSSFIVIFGGRLYVRFKRLDNALRPDNVATDQNDEMLAQFPLPGHGPNPSYPIAGYVLNELETAIKGVHIILPLPTYNFWSYEINADGRMVEVIEEPMIFPLDDMLHTKTKVKPKPQIRKKDAPKKNE